MIFLSDLYFRILVKTGQYHIRENLEIKNDLFPVIVQEALDTLNIYCPYKEKRYLSFHSRREYVFSEGEGIPEKITDMIPYGDYSSLFLFNQERMSKGFDTMGLSLPSHRPFLYDKPRLTVAVSANYEVTCSFNHKITDIEVPGEEPSFKKPGLLHMSTDTLSSDFFKLITGHFQQAIGRSRRTFQLQEVPFSMDADQQVQEGEQLIREAEENLKENHSQFYDAYY